MAEAMKPERFQEQAAAIEAALSQVIVGQREMQRGLIVTLLAGGHALLEGAPGLGKTLVVRTLAQVIGADFSRIQFTPDLMPADIVGTQIIAEDEAGRRRWRFEPGPIFSNLVLADEINRATPKTQSAMLEAMQERSVSVGRSSHPLTEPFFVLATQNPIEMEGTYPLPEAQLDRFLLMLRIGMPSFEELMEISDRSTGEREPVAPKVLDLEQLRAMQALVRQVPIAPQVTAHAVHLVMATQPDREDAPEAVRRFVEWGAGPRAVQSLVLAGKARALLAGRFNVAAKDLDALAPAVLRHRLVASFEARAEGQDMDAVVAAAIGAAEARSETGA